MLVGKLSKLQKSIEFCIWKNQSLWAMAAKTPGQGPDKPPDKARTSPSRPRIQNRAIQGPKNRAD